MRTTIKSMVYARRCSDQTGKKSVRTQSGIAGRQPAGLAGSQCGSQVSESHRYRPLYIEGGRD